MRLAAVRKRNGGVDEPTSSIMHRMKRGRPLGPSDLTDSCSPPLQTHPSSLHPPHQLHHQPLPQGFKRLSQLPSQPSPKEHPVASYPFVEGIRSDAATPPTWILKPEVRQPRPTTHGNSLTDSRSSDPVQCLPVQLQERQQGRCKGIDKGPGRSKGRATPGRTGRSH